MITLDDAKTYLRVDSSDEDTLITSLITQAEILVQDVARVEEIADESVFRIAALYAVAYLFEHREEPDMKELTLMLRAILFGQRRAVF